MEQQERVVIITLLSSIAVTVIICGIYQQDIVITLNSITKSHFSETIDVNKKNIFDTMADIQNYPNILPDNVLSVTIVNNTGNTIFAKERVSETGIQTDLLVKHTIIPYREHTIEIVQGAAQGTIIKVTFDDLNTSTQISTDTELHLHGILAPFNFIAQSNLHHAMNTILTKFVQYSQNH